MFKFTATHGVHLYDLGVQFVRDASVDDAVVYAYETGDALLAAALLKVDGYGIKTDESTEKAAASAERKAEKEAAEAAEAAEREAAEAAQRLADTEREAGEQAAATRPSEDKK